MMNQIQDIFDRAIDRARDDCREGSEHMKECCGCGGDFAQDKLVKGFDGSLFCEGCAAEVIGRFKECLEQFDVFELDLLTRRTDGCTLLEVRDA